LSKSISKHVRREKEKNHKKNSVRNKELKVLMLRDIHTRGCTSEVKHQLNNECEVFGLINPGSGMKDIKESAKREIAQLTREDIVVLWEVRTMLEEITP
jgi:hypothetical protein